MLAQTPPLPIDKGWLETLARSPWWLAVLFLLGFLVWAMLARNKGGSFRLLAFDPPDKPSPVTTQPVDLEGSGVHSGDLFDLRRELRVDRDAQTTALRRDMERLSEQLDRVKSDLTDSLGVISRQRYDAGSSSSLSQDEAMRAQTQVLRKLLEGVDKVLRALEERLPPGGGQP